MVCDGPNFVIFEMQWLNEEGHVWLTNVFVSSLRQGDRRLKACYKWYASFFPPHLVFVLGFILHI